MKQKGNYVEQVHEEAASDRCTFKVNDLLRRCVTKVNSNELWKDEHGRGRTVVFEEEAGRKSRCKGDQWAGVQKDEAEGREVSVGQKIIARRTAAANRK